MIKRIRALYLWILLAPMMSWGLGITFNTLVLSANHGRMPSTMMEDYAGDRLIDEIHKIHEPSDHFKIFTDWIVGPPFEEHVVYSLGDLMIDVGELWPLFFIFWLGLILFAPLDLTSQFATVKGRNNG